MSMELYAFSDHQLASLAEWQASIDTEGFGLVLPEDMTMAELRGFLPCKRGGQPTGFECDHWDAAEIQDGYLDVRFPKRWPFCLAFRWTGDPDETLAAYQAATAYAKATSGVVFDPQDGVVLTPDEVLAAAAQLKAEMPKIRTAIAADFFKLAK